MTALHEQAKVSVLYVPNGMALDDVIDEINVMGFVASPPWWHRWRPSKRGSWQVLVCEGVPCRCPAADESRSYVHRVNGEVVFDGCDQAVFPPACKLRRLAAKWISHIPGPWVS